MLDLASLTWTQVALDPEALKPSGRLRMSHVDDPARNRMIVSCGIADYFGVGDPRNVMYNDSWALDYNTFEWTQLPTINDPPLNNAGGCDPLRST